MNERVSFNDLIGTIASKSQASKAFTNSLVKEMAIIIQEGLLRDSRVTINGLGIFKLQEIPARAGKSIKTGEVITIPAKRKVLFKPEKQLRELINKKFQHLRPQIIQDTIIPVKPSKPAEKADDEPEAIKSSYFQDLFEEEEPVKKEVVSDTKPENPVLNEQRKAEPEKPFVSYNKYNSKEKKSGKVPIVLSVIAILLLIFFYTEFSNNDDQTDEQANISKTEPIEKVNPVATAAGESKRAEKAMESEKINKEKHNTTESKNFQNHAAQYGDNLWNLAQTYYNDGYLWPLIYQANHDKIKNPDIIDEGINLKIPEFKQNQKINTELSKGHVLAYFAYKKDHNRDARNHLFVAKKYDQDYVKEIKSQIDEEDIQYVNGLTMR